MVLIIIVACSGILIYFYKSVFIYYTPRTVGEYFGSLT